MSAVCCLVRRTMMSACRMPAASGFPTLLVGIFLGFESRNSKLGRFCPKRERGVHRRVMQVPSERVRKVGTCIFYR